MYVAKSLWHPWKEDLEYSLSNFLDPRKLLSTHTNCVCEYHPQKNLDLYQWTKIANLPNYDLKSANKFDV